MHGTKATKNKRISNRPYPYFAKNWQPYQPVKQYIPSRKDEYLDRYYGDWKQQYTPYSSKKFRNYLFDIPGYPNPPLIKNPADFKWKTFF